MARIASTLLLGCALLVATLPAASVMSGLTVFAVGIAYRLAARRGH
jgi:hypothetical protein